MRKRLDHQCLRLQYFLRLGLISANARVRSNALRSSQPRSLTRQRLKAHSIRSAFGLHFRALRLHRRVERTIHHIMPPERRTSGGVPKPTNKPFKPQRPSTTSAANGKSTTTSKPARSAPKASSKSAARTSTGSTSRPAAKTQQRRQTPSEDEDEDEEEDEEDDDDDSDDERSARQQRPRPSNSNQQPEQPQPTSAIPANLLTRLLNTNFASESTRISKAADKAVGRYMDIFVREAVARAAVESAKGKNRAGGGGFMEVEDLEKLAPQLVLDF